VRLLRGSEIVLSKGLVSLTKRTLNQFSPENWCTLWEELFQTLFVFLLKNYKKLMKILWFFY